MRYILWTGAAVFLLLQIVPAPHRITHPESDLSLSIAADPDVPPAVLKVLNRSCMDCHSNQTRVPWYGYVAPASWILAKDVTEARQMMNLSAWRASTPAVHVALAAAACADVKSGRMPKAQYLLLHPEARLSQDDVQALCEWPKAAVAVMLRKRQKTQQGISE
jgi:hypothetical protein